MKTSKSLSFAIIALIAFLCDSRASAITDPGVIIQMNGGTASLTWNATAIGVADVEHSEDLISWSSISQNNTMGSLLHAIGGASKGFYRLRPIFKSPDTIYVIGGILPHPHGLEGTEVEDFFVGKFEVTLNEWILTRDWAINNGYDLNGVGSGSGGDHPVRNVSWYDSVKWCNALSEREGLTPYYLAPDGIYKTGQVEPVFDKTANGYRLPTQAEWEWAAKGGIFSQGYIYSGSDNMDEVGWDGLNSIGASVAITSGGRGTWPVGQKLANELGIHDMSGNVWEWCENLISDTRRRVRGGSFHLARGYCEMSHPGLGYRASAREFPFGFRIARNAP